jgi:hypothetical protein
MLLSELLPLLPLLLLETLLLLEMLLLLLLTLRPVLLLVTSRALAPLAGERRGDTRCPYWAPLLESSTKV